MYLIRGLPHLNAFTRGCVLSIGNFDGVHIGHQQVINKLVKQGFKMNLPVVLMIFEPQPLEFFLTDNAPSRLTRLREKTIQLKALPIDYLLVIKFNQTFADFEDQAFIKNILVNQLNVKHLIVGDDFHFGHKRQGNFKMLQQQGRDYGFTVESMMSVYVNRQRVSSTLIRDALAAGELNLARQMLGRDYSICGRIVHGNKRGRMIGFPTANIQMFRKNTPISGVFAVMMSGVGQSPKQGIANVGIRPTVEGDKTVMLEVHLFDFSQDIYGSYVEVHFKQKIRDEICFSSLTKLKQQIEKDVALTKQLFHYH